MKEIERIATSHSEVTPSIRPGVSPSMLEALGSDPSMKLFYAAMRLEKDYRTGIIDIGSGYRIDQTELTHTEEVIDSAHLESKRRGYYTEYVSSYGSLELRHAIYRYFRRWGGVEIDSGSEVMVTRGITDSYDRVLQSLDITHVIIPSWAPFFARSHAVVNGKQVIVVPLDMGTGDLDLDVLDQHLQEVGIEQGRVLMYVTHPSAPLGTVMEDKFIEEKLIPCLRQQDIWLFSDSHIGYTRFDGKGVIRPILSYKGAKDIAVEAITVAKEFGIPGARAGGLAGNTEIINAVRLLAAIKSDIVSGVSQMLAAKALDEVDASIVGERIKRELFEQILPRFKAIDWRVIKPKAGFDMLMEVPPGFTRKHVENPSLLAAFSILRRYGVGFCPCSPLSESGKYYLRLILKQEQGKIPMVLDKLKGEGFNWRTACPSEEDMLYLEYLQSHLDLTKL